MASFALSQNPLIRPDEHIDTPNTFMNVEVVKEQRMSSNRFVTGVLHKSVVILIASHRSYVLESFPGEILELICDSTEDVVLEEATMAQEVSDELFSSYPAPLPEQEAGRAALGVPQECTTGTNVPNIPLLKHRKNQFVLTMTQVCRGWRLRLKHLWRIIAFDADSEPASVHLAMLFLSKIKDNRGIEDDHGIEDGRGLVQVYAGLPLNDLVDPAVAALLSNLRDRTNRLERFIYWGRLGQYRRYLDLPAPRLRWFSDNRDISHLYSGQKCRLFAGHTPMLRYLVTSTPEQWNSAALINLSTLHLRVCDASLSIKSLLNALRCTPQLVEFKLASPTTFPHDCPACKPVDLPHMRSIRLFNPDLHTILSHLVIPNVRSVEVSSVHPSIASGLQVGLAFQAPHFLVGFPSIPALKLPISFIHFSVQCSPTRFWLTIDLRTEDDASFVVKLSWMGDQKIYQWKSYFERSVSSLAEMRVVPCPAVSIIVEFPFDYTPLLYLPGIKVVAFVGDLQGLLQVLADPGGGYET